MNIKHRNIAYQAIEVIKKKGGAPTGGADQSSTPFPYIINPLVQYAFQLLVCSLTPSQKTLLPALKHSSMHSLEQRITKCLGRTLLLEFNIYRSENFGDLDHEVQKVGSLKSSEMQACYSFWFNSGDGWDNLFKQYSALPLLLGSTLRDWLDNTQEFIQRLHSDLDELSSCFGIANNISEITLDHSDPHNGGRTVHIISTYDNKRIVYKPKDLELARAIHSFSVSLEELTGISSFRSPKTLVKQNYGWQEFIEFTEELSPKEVVDYYHRCGSALAVLHLLNGEDIHYENIICSNARPYIVDTEMLLTPRIKSGNFENSTKTLLWNSVLRTGMLPRWNTSANGAFDVSALGCTVDMIHPEPIATWVDQGFDSVHIASTLNRTIKCHHRPIKSNLVFDYLADIKNGFSEMYDSLVIHKATVTALLSPFRLTRTRVLFRTTREYAYFLRIITSPHSLTDTETFDATLRKLCKNHSEPNQSGITGVVSKCEIKHLRRLDIPYFSLPTKSTKKWLFNAPIESGYNSVRQNLENFGEDDKSVQLKIIDLSFHANKASSDQCFYFDSCRDIETTVGKEHSFEKSILSEVTKISQKIINDCIINPRFGITWLNLEHNNSMSRYQLETMTDSMYSGITGVGVFLSTIHTEETLDQSQKILKTIVDSIKKTIREHKLTNSSINGNCSAFFGWPSISYGLSVISQNTQDTELMNLALKVIESFNWSGYSDKNSDFLNGAAGAIRALVALYDRTLQPWLIDLACENAEKLIKSQVLLNSKSAAWQSQLSDSFLVGFAHGQSGIAYALAVLNERVNSTKYTEAVIKALNFEDEIIKESGGKIPDFRIHSNKNTPRSRGFTESWCTGTTGVALARQAILKESTCTRILEKVLAGNSSAPSLHFSEMDHLCCGNTGKLEFFIETSSTNTSPFALHLIRNTNHYNVYSNIPTHTPNYSLFKGISGIGYTLQRTLNKHLPSLLLLK